MLHRHLQRFTRPQAMVMSRPAFATWRSRAAKSIPAFALSSDHKIMMN